MNISMFGDLYKLAVANNNMPKAKMSSALVKRGTVLSYGFNSLKSDPLQAKYSKNYQSIFLHAEIHAIKNALKGGYSLSDIEGSSLYVCRVKLPHAKSTRYEFGMSKPCIGCKRAIVEFGIKCVHYTTDNEGFKTLP